MGGDARMAMPSQNDADRDDGSNIDCASEQEPSFAAQLRKALNTIPAYTWYALPSGVLTFANERYADYLGLDKDDPLRLGGGGRCNLVPTFSWYIPTITKQRSKSGKPVTELGQPAKRPSEYETLKENTAGSSVASNLTEQAWDVAVLDRDKPRH
jgi:PAS domain-containing protein